MRFAPDGRWVDMRLPLAALILPVCLLGIPVAADAPRQASAVRGNSGNSDGMRRFALLVGVTAFDDPSLRRFNLKGPANDATLLQAVLQGPPFFIPASNIFVLTTTAKRAEDRPTYSAIRGAFRRLADLARPGDQVAIFMAGHGSQQPEASPSTDEPDGFDEIFLPSDVGSWDGTRRAVRNAIVDDELAVWLDNIRDRGAFVWLMIDACHAGTMSRGGETVRQISMAELMPREVADAAPTLARQTGGATELPLGLHNGKGGIAALYASTMDETTPEKPLPGPGSPVHGLFSYTVATILSQNSGPMTYRQLAVRVLEQYPKSGSVLADSDLRGGGSRRRSAWPAHVARTAADAAHGQQERRHMDTQCRQHSWLNGRLDSRSVSSCGSANVGTPARTCASDCRAADQCSRRADDVCRLPIPASIAARCGQSRTSSPLRPGRSPVTPSTADSFARIGDRLCVHHSATRLRSGEHRARACHRGGRFWWRCRAGQRGCARLVHSNRIRRRDARPCGLSASRCAGWQ